MKPCECGHIYTYHNEKGCGGTVEFKGVAVRNFKPCGCTHYRPDQDAPQKELDSLFNRRPICPQNPNFICDGYHHHFDFKSMREVCPNTSLGEVTYPKSEETK